MKKPAMTKEVFEALLERQRSSGKGVKPFCRQEGYSPASFQYWRRKFCSDRPHTESAAGSRSGTGSLRKDISEGFAPVSFHAQGCGINPPSEGHAHVPDEIVIELPDGIRVYFRGASNERAAMGLINRICTGDVLSE